MTESELIRLNELVELPRKLTKEEDDELDDLQWKYRSSKTELFREEFVKPILPGANNSSSTISTAHPRKVHLGTDIGAPSGNDFFLDSDYSFIPKETDRLAHFTSFQAAQEIIRSNSLRMTALDSMDDPREVSFAADISGFPKRSIDEMVQEHFSVSFNHFPEGIEDEKYPYWENYGHKGYGVSLLFSLNASSIPSWRQFHLGKVLYGKEKLKRFENLESRIQEWIRTEEFMLTGYHRQFAKLFAFHKEDFYEPEHEVRLLHHPFVGTRSWADKILEEEEMYSTINSKGKLSHYRKLSFGKKFDEVYDLEGRIKVAGILDEKYNRSKSQFFPSQPRLEIRDIILGYRVSKNLMNPLYELCEAYLDHPVRIVQSKFRAHFE